MKAQRTTLISWSGGVDSTHALWAALRAGDRVVAHHVTMVNGENRHIAELNAITAMRDWFEAQGHTVVFSASMVARHTLLFQGWDVITVASELGVAAVHDRVLTGKMPDRWQLGICQEDMTGGATLNAQATGPRLRQVKAAFAAACWPEVPSRYCRPPVRPKADLVADMPAALVGLCWCCRTPEDLYNPTPCGQCRACQDLERAMEARA